MNHTNESAAVSPGKEQLLAQAYCKDLTKLSPYCTPMLREIMPKCGHCGAEMHKDGDFPMAAIVSVSDDQKQTTHIVLAVCPDCVPKAKAGMAVIPEHTLMLDNGHMLNLLHTLFDYALGRAGTEHGFPLAVMNLNFLMKNPLAWNPRDAAMVFNINTKPTAVHFVHEADDPPFRFGPAIREAEAIQKLIKTGRIEATYILGSLILESSDPTTTDFVNKAVAKGQTFPPKGKRFGVVERGVKA